MEREAIAVSACLLGVSCKYSGENNLNIRILKELAGKEIIPICPEVFGGMTTPRIPSEIQKDGRVISFTGKDVTKNFVIGTDKTLSIMKEYGCVKAILKDGSPSCGYKTVYDGTFTHEKISGKGITALALVENGIEIINLNT